MTIFAKLVKVQTEVGGIHKDSQNPHLKNRFASLEAILSELVPALNTASLFLTQNVDQGHDGTWAVETCVYDGTEKTSDKVSLGRVPVINSKGDAQGLGAAITYARRYGLAAAFGLWQTDSDGEDCKPTPRREPRLDNKGAVVAPAKPAEPATPKVTAKVETVTPDVTPVVAAKVEEPAVQEERFSYVDNTHRSLLTKAVKESKLTAQQLNPVRAYFTEGRWEKEHVPADPAKLCAFIKKIAGVEQ